MTPEQPAAGPRVCLLGAAPDTGNLGVSALLASAVDGLVERVPDVQLTIFDNRRGPRDGVLTTGSGQVRHRRLGARAGHRYDLPENVRTMRAAARLGRGGAGPRAVRAAAAVLDASGGDSFTDLYGRKRFVLNSAPKLMAVEVGTPLVLLPQTIGPFRTARARRAAVRILDEAALVVARGADSRDAIEVLLGARFDPRRHLRGVDMAFGLRPQQPAPAVSRWLDAVRARADGSPVVGLNVSGLVMPRDAASRYGLACDYRQAVIGLARALVAEGCTLVLVPHVLGPLESDVDACAEVADAVGRGTCTAPADLGPGHVKWLVDRLDWFCGTRMHSTIAALSSGRPVAGIAYSPKVAEVFDSCGVGEDVIDARRLGTAEVVEASLEAFHRRVDSARRIAAALPSVLAAAGAQMDRICAVVTDDVPAAAAVSRSA